MDKFLRFYKKLFSQENIDKTIYGGIKSQIKLLLISIITLLLIFSVFVIIFSINLGESDNLGQRLWLVYNNFIDSGNQIAELSWKNRIFVSIVSLFGTILLGGILISTISNIIERRVDAIKAGKVTYRNIKNHYIIIGFCETTISLIKELCNNNYGTPIILISSYETELIRSAIQSQLNHNEEDNVKIYFGNLDSEEELSRLNVHLAKGVYILGDENTGGRDSKNIETVHKISMLRGNHSNKPLLDVYVQFDRIPSYSNIQKIKLPENYYCHDGIPNIYFRPFNYFENWARLLWGVYSLENSQNYYALDYNNIRIEKDDNGNGLVNSKDYVHLVIVGFNRMGRSLLLEALRICHYANYDDSLPYEKRIRTLITLIDKNMDEMKDYFKSQFPYIDNQIDDINIEYINSDICDPGIRKSLQTWCNDKHRMLTVAICISDPDMSLSLGLNLPPEIYENEIPVLIRQINQTDMGKLIDTDKGKYKKVKIFGMLSKGMQSSLLDDSLPSYIHQSYTCNECNDSSKCMLYKQKGCKYNTVGKENYLNCLYNCFKNNDPQFQSLSNCAHYSWLSLSEVKRWSNRYQIDAYLIYCRTLGYNVCNDKFIKSNDTDKYEIVSPECIKKNLDTNTMEIMMRMEKHRWNAERTIEGYRYGPVRDDTHQIHPLILPFNKLKASFPEEQTKDYNVIENMPYLLEIGGYKIIKHS